MVEGGNVIHHVKREGDCTGGYVNGGKCPDPDRLVGCLFGLHKEWSLSVLSAGGRTMTAATRCLARL